MLTWRASFGIDRYYEHLIDLATQEYLAYVSFDPIHGYPITVAIYLPDGKVYLKNSFASIREAKLKIQEAFEEG